MSRGGLNNVAADACWKSFHLTSNKFFKNKDKTPLVLGGLSIQSDTTNTEVVVSSGAGNDDEYVYKYGIPLTSAEGLHTYTPYIPMPGIVFPNGMFVDIGASPDVSVLYKGKHE